MPAIERQQIGPRLSQAWAKQPDRLYSPDKSRATRPPMLQSRPSRSCARSLSFSPAPEPTRSVSCRRRSGSPTWLRLPLWTS